MPNERAQPVDKNQRQDSSKNNGGAGGAYTSKYVDEGRLHALFFLLFTLLFIRLSKIASI